MTPDPHPRALPNAPGEAFGHVDICAILGRDPGSVLHPLECRGSDGELYFVKIQKSDLRPLICEWVCGRLATILRLPIPPIRLAWLPDELVAASKYKGYDIVSGWAFASRAVPHADAFPKAVSTDVAEVVRHRVLAFDHWVHNADRRDANTNLLWQASGKNLWVIDHHDTLSQSPVRTAAMDHVFREDWPNLWHSADIQKLIICFKLAMLALPPIWDEMPDLWKEAHPALLPDITNLLARTLP